LAVRIAWFFAGLLASLALASGFDLSVGVRAEPELRFLSGLGVALEAAPWTLRGGLRFGAPSGILAEGEVDFALPVPVVRPYLGVGAAAGLTARQGDGRFEVALGRVGYALFTLGASLPARGYRPYLEATYYLGNPGFARYSAGFVLEVPGW